MSKFKAIVLICASAALVLGGCGGPTIDMTKTGKGFFPATDPDHVEILSTLPSRSFKEVATFSTGGWNTTDTAKMHNGIRVEAAGVGGDAAVIQASGVNQVKSTFGDSYSLWTTGVVVSFTED